MILFRGELLHTWGNGAIQPDRIIATIHLSGECSQRHLSYGGQEHVQNMALELHQGGGAVC